MTASGHTSADSLRLPAGAGAKANLEDAVGWQDLPRKKQLVVITLARLSEPLVQTSLQSYMYYQLKWFDSTLPDSVISSQAGVLTASFTAAQFLTAMLWGRVADSTRFGRKTVLMIGLGGTMLSCLGFGFSTTFWQALFFRSLGGITNGNVGVMRTMISEIVREKKYQSRAFLLLPMTFNIGVIIGPVLGGILSDPAGSYPTVFGRVKFFRDFPYAAPNILSTFFLLCATLSVWLNLEETLDARRDKRDIGLEFGNKLSGALGTLYGCRMHPVDYTPLASRDASVPIEMASTSTSRRSAPDTYTQPDRARQAVRRRYTRRLPFRRIFTRNVSCTLVAHFLLAFHVGTFNSLWFVFLSTPVYDADKATESSHALQRKPPFFFTGGLGLQPREVGMAMAILGVLGISLQLLVYPKLSARLGTLRSWRLFLMCFPFTYFLVPYLSLVPSTSPPPHPKDGIGVWASIAGVLLFQVVGRTFALPAQTILVNNCTPHPSVLGTVHGLGQSVSSFARTIGPMLCGFLYGLGLAKGIVGAVWWGLSGVAVCGVLASWWVREGDGHEIRLDGDDDGDS
ncbi:major facilitator superfamily domain-containing protein [Coniochaeta sp. 2T2.1]|nr:major facilitator superfamily domain-containing protein [Coniochaeta sp. 2T2.1]